MIMITGFMNGFRAADYYVYVYIRSLYRSGPNRMSLACWHAVWKIYAWSQPLQWYTTLRWCSSRKIKWNFRAHKSSHWSWYIYLEHIHFCVSPHPIVRNKNCGVSPPHMNHNWRNAYWLDWCTLLLCYYTWWKTLGIFGNLWKLVCYLSTGLTMALAHAHRHIFPSYI